MRSDAPLRGAPPVPLVLLVEDHQDTRQMYAEFLGPSFEVIPAANGEEALAALRARRPDLVITDLSLPGMDGFELIAHIRRDPSLRAIPIVCLSGYGGHAHEQRARAAGSDRILQKPCMPDALADVIRELIRDTAERSSNS
jgi:CheY-like chemotaxis protein